MTGWWVWLLAGGALGVLTVVAVCVVVGRQSEERRGGLLELDTWEARNALKHPPPVDDWFSPSKLRRCNRERQVHFHGAGDWCECGDVPNVRAIRPFAGGGGDAA